MKNKANEFLNIYFLAIFCLLLLLFSIFYYQWTLPATIRIKNRVIIYLIVFPLLYIDFSPSMFKYGRWGIEKLLNITHRSYDIFNIDIHPQLYKQHKV